MFGFIKKLFSGIFGFLGSLFGGKKSKDSGYFLEFEEAQSTGSASAKLEGAAPKAADALAAPAAAAATPVVAAATGQPETPTAPTPAPVVPPVAVMPKPTPVVAAKPAVPAGPATFAPQYLAPKPSNSRRRPGPSLSPYLTMAKQMR
ncbi:hypothetical protein [Trichothermofontia sp.]